MKEKYGIQHSLSPVMELTTMIGCPLMCTFCPQDALRTQYGVDALTPGLTGWAQINGRDELSIPDKVQYDVEYLQRKSFWFDMKILGILNYLHS